MLRAVDTTTFCQPQLGQVITGMLDNTLISLTTPNLPAGSLEAVSHELTSLVWSELTDHVDHGLLPIPGVTYGNRDSMSLIVKSARAGRTLIKFGVVKDRGSACRVSGVEHMTNANHASLRHPSTVIDRLVIVGWTLAVKRVGGRGRLISQVTMPHYFIGEADLTRLRGGTVRHWKAGSGYLKAPVSLGASFAALPAIG